MRAHDFLVLASLAIFAVSASFGKAASLVPENSSMTDVVSPASTRSRDCDSNWSSWSAGVGRPTSTMTVSVTASAVEDPPTSPVSSIPPLSPPSPPLPPVSPLSPSLLEFSASITTTTSTTTTTVTITAPVFTDLSNTSIPALESSRSTKNSPTSGSSDEPDFQTASAISTDFSPGFTQLTTSTTDSAAPSSTSATYCPIEPFNKTYMRPFFGFNVVNTKPSDPQLPSAGYKTKDDWQAAFALLKQYFTQINAVRMYSTTDGDTPHLMNAMDTAINNNLSILVGVWSGGNGVGNRFDAEKSALHDVISRYGCDNFAAISVGNEDLNQININNPNASDDVKDDLKNATAFTLMDQIWQVRNMTRAAGAGNPSCCNVPITHTDTWNEFSDTGKPWIPQLMSTVDQATIVNIFPYWSDAQVTNSWNMIAQQSNWTLAATKEYGKDVWLGETGWAAFQPQLFNKFGTNSSDAQQYFNQVGCQILSGTSTGFYYVDWDQDAPKNGRPAFGLFDYTGDPILSLDCTRFKPDMRMKDYEYLPAFMGISQARQ